VGEHTGFHRQVGGIARLVNAGQTEQALAAMAGGTPFAEATQSTVRLIRQLIQECGQHELTSRPAGMAPATLRREAPAATEDWTAF
jgi:hypothetical protein